MKFSIRSRALDVGDDLLVLAVVVVIPLHELEDVVDVDLHLLDQLHLEAQVVHDVGRLVPLLVAQLAPGLDVAGLVVLQLAVGHRVVLGELVPGGQHVAQAKYRAERHAEVALRCASSPRGSGHASSGKHMRRCATCLRYSAR